MSASSASIISRLREIRSRRPSAEEYGRELVRLADLQFDTASDFDSAELDFNRMRALRNRLKTLEKKVQELEALK